MMDSERIRPALAPTGDSRVDAAIGGLASIEDVDLAERPAVLETVHDRLREILGELGDPGRPADQARPGEPGRRGQQGELGGAFQPGGVQARPGQPQPAPPRPAPPRPAPQRPSRPPQNPWDQR
jgi:hypothetical protein